MAPAQLNTTPRISDAARSLADGSLGSRLLRMARLAAATHMAETALPRKDAAQALPAPRASRVERDAQ